MDIWSFEENLSCSIRLEGHKALRLVIKGQRDVAVENVIKMEFEDG